MSEKKSLIDWSKVATGLVSVLIVGAIGFFFDFRQTKADTSKYREKTNDRLNALEKKDEEQEEKIGLIAKVSCRLIQKIDKENAPNDCYRLGKGD